MSKPAKRTTPALTRGQVDAAFKALDEAPELPAEKQPVTMREAIASQRERIEAAKAKGYSMEAIAEILRKAGLAVTATTLASYARPSRKRAVAKTGATRKSDTKPNANAPATGEAELQKFHHNPARDKKELI